MHLTLSARNAALDARQATQLVSPNKTSLEPDTDNGDSERCDTPISAPRPPLPAV